MKTVSPRLLLAAPLFALAACGGTSSETAATATATAEPTPASSDWVQQNPTEPAVPVTLPTTAMHNAPPTP